MTATGARHRPEFWTAAAPYQLNRLFAGATTGCWHRDGAVRTGGRARAGRSAILVRTTGPADPIREQAMATTPAAPAPQAGRARTLHLSQLLRRPLTDRGGESIGRLSDVIVRLRGAENPIVTGLVATVGGREVYVPVEQVGSFGADAVGLTSARLDLRSFERRDGEVLL